MLHSLHIRDLALIEQAEARPHQGLNVISGETGGGKSLLITALKLLRGEKAQGNLVRHEKEELQVDAEFRLGTGERSAQVSARVKELCGAEPEEGLLLVTRIVDRQGRSKVRLCGRPATLQALREVGTMLLEIHGQGDSRALMRPEIQCETLDAFAGLGALRSEFAAALAAARTLRERLRNRAAGERERAQRLEFLRFQVQEMQQARLQPGEVAALEAEHQVLQNLDAMREHLDGALGALQDGEPNAADLLGQAERRLDAAAAIDPRLQGALDGVAEAQERLADACRQVQSGLGRLELDPNRLQEVVERLDELHRLLKRWGPTEADFAQQLAAAVAELAEHEAMTADPDALPGQLKQATALVVALGRRLLKARRKAAPAFVRAITAELAGLGMARTEARVAMAEDFAEATVLDEANEHGPVPVDLEVRINPGEPFHSMRDTASGGELARIVLAVKKTLADQDRVPLLVLDEIDAEIGGRLGTQVGHKLTEVARHHQVVIVTHLPQVAAFADRHFLVKKEVVGRGREERTRSAVLQLQGAAVEKELAAMAAGDGADAEAVAQARSLVRKARAGEAGGAVSG